jgi:hypothetical protein
MKRTGEFERLLSLRATRGAVIPGKTSVAVVTGAKYGASQYEPFVPVYSDRQDSQQPLESGS